MVQASEFQDLVRTKAFWSEYFGLESSETGPWESERQVVITMPVGNGYSLDLLFHLPYVNEVQLRLNSASIPDPLAIAGTGFCSYPPVFRWSELDLLSRAIAADDPSSLMTKHLAILLLVRFTPLCEGDSQDVLVDAVHTLLSSLGFDLMEIRYVLRTIDHRSTGYKWRFDDVVNGWVLQRYRNYTSGYNLYTHRSTDNKDFPFEIWPHLLSAAEETIRNSKNTSSSRELEGGTLVTLPNYDLPTQHDAYLIVPMGIIPRPLFKGAERFLNRALNRVLEDLDLGYSKYVGGTHPLNEKGGEFRLEVKMYGEVERSLLVLRQVLWWQMASEESSISDLKYSRLSKFYPLREITGELKGDKVEFHVVFGTLQAFGQEFKPQASRSRPCNALFQSALDESEASPDQNGWRILRTGDGGEIHICVFQASTSRKEDLVTVTLKRVTPEVARFLFHLLVKGQLVLLPALLTAVKDENGSFNIVTSENELLDVLNDGPYQWWLKTGSTYVRSDL